MTGWRDDVLKHFTPRSAPLFAASDPDGLLTEPGVVEELQVRGFDLVTYDDPIVFRHLYETTYRPGLEEGHAVLQGEESPGGKPDHGHSPRLVVRTPSDLLTRAKRTKAIQLDENRL